ncbi:unnamed protein product, partial [Tetraodon nigroviridis]
MGDHAEFASQITPETPGRPSIRNPFESPNDYHHLREALVPSPSAFKSKPCKSTPPKFDWSIDEMASLLPVHIDPEEIQRQSFYLSQTRYLQGGGHLGSDLCPLTQGHYYRHEEEAGDPVQESLSSSSLRRKLFLDGQSSFSGSDSSGPPSPERGFSRRDSPLKQAGAAEEEDAAASVRCSPLACGRLAQTPSTGQFSSSPIQNGRFRDCSLGSIASPLLPHRSSPAGLPTPSVSPIVVPGPNSPSSADRKQQSGAAPYEACPPCSQSPFVEGCSPIHSCSPHPLQSYGPAQQGRAKPRPRVRSRLSPPLISPILSPKLQDNQEAGLPPCSSSSSSSSLPPMDLDPAPPPSGQNRQHGVVVLDPTEPLRMEEDKQQGMAERLNDEEEEGGEPSAQLTSSRMGNVSSTDSTRMCVSLLAEGSSLRYDSSMQ